MYVADIAVWSTPPVPRGGSLRNIRGYVILHQVAERCISVPLWSSSADEVFTHSTPANGGVFRKLASRLQIVQAFHRRYMPPSVVQLPCVAPFLNLLHKTNYFDHSTHQQDFQLVTLSLHSLMNSARDSTTLDHAASGKGQSSSRFPAGGILEHTQPRGGISTSVFESSRHRIR